VTAQAVQPQQAEQGAEQPVQRRAIALVSGGLDSMLAVKVMQEQGIHVEGVNFFTGFCVEGHTQAIRKKDQDKHKRNDALWVAEVLGIKLHIVDISEEYKDVVLNPKYGYGANLNPCLDCKIFMVNQANLMVNKAREFAGEKGFDFVITGEVVGQRPKSQRSETMPIVSSESGADDRLLRPLCARNLPETLPEREGWVNRDELHAFSGRNRKPQMELARKYGLEDYAQPSGGCCFLTDESYSRKLQDLWQARDSRDYEMDDIMLLKVGRHIRPRPHFKLIVSREEGENNFLEGYKYRFTSLVTTSCPGPLALIDGDLADEEEEQFAASLVARYSKGRMDDQVTVELQRAGGVSKVLNVAPMGPRDIPDEWHVG